MLVWGLGGWTFHSMMELNYETPGSLGLAVVLAAVVLYRCPPPDRLPDRLFDPRPARLAFLLLCAAATAAALLYVPPVVRSEMAFDRLHSMTDPRFASDRQGLQTDPETVRRALAECDPRSPFPFAEVSSYYFAKGPYYVADALSMLDEAIKRTPKRSAYHHRKYRIYSMLGRPQEAEAALMKARELSPKNPQYYPDGVTPFGTRSY